MTTSLMSDTLAELVGTIPGVMTLYSPEPVIARAAKVALATVLRSPATTDRIQVTDGPAGVHVSVHLGVSRTQSAAAVCRDVYEHISSAIRADGQDVDRIVVKVGRVS